MHQVARRWLFVGLVFAGLGLAFAGWAQPLPQASIAVDTAPDVRGRIDIGAPPPPRWQPAEPVYVQHPALQVQQQQRPIYLAVAPEHARKWRKHCYRYGACARPVVLVQQPERDGRPDRDGYWQNGNGYGRDYRHHKHHRKDKHRHKHRHGEND